MKALIIIPTYNEKDNLAKITEQAFSLRVEVHILIIDDNSPDGTGEIADKLATGDSRLSVIHREGKLGLGSAYIAGFKWALEKGYDYIFEMDADGSHDPVYIPRFLEKIKECDLVLGSRYTVGVSVIDWTLKRLFLSKLATKYVRVITGLPATDATGGFKCFRRKVLESIDLDKIGSNGYSFQIELTYNAWMKGFRIREIPIIFYNRVKGKSKMSGKITLEALWVVWKLALRDLFRRKPKREAFFQLTDPTT